MKTYQIQLTQDFIQNYYRLDLLNEKLICTDKNHNSYIPLQIEIDNLQNEVTSYLDKVIYKLAKEEPLILNNL